MEQITNFIENITAVQVVDVLIAIGIILFFRIFSSSFSYIIIRMFKIKERKSKNIRESAFYSPLKIFFIILGFYLAVVFLKAPLDLFAKGLATSFTPKSSLYQKIKEKTSKDIEDSMFDFILKIIRVVIYIIAGFIVITAVGINLNGLVAGLGIGGVIFTLAAQDTAKNLFAGLVVFLDKPFVVGDWIQVD